MGAKLRFLLRGLRILGAALLCIIVVGQPPVLAATKSKSIESIINQTPYYDPSSEPCSADAPTQPVAVDPGALLKTMQSLPLREKIGQLLIAEVSNKDEAVKLEGKYQLGGIFLPGGATSLYNKGATDAVKAAGKVPALISIDQEGGKVQRLSGTIGSYPSAKTLGGLSPNEITRIATEQAKKMKDIGITLDLAPVVDIDDGKNAAIATKDRSFSTDYTKIAERAGAFAKGLRDGGVVPTLKHFPGIGTSQGNSDVERSITRPLATLESQDLVPYESLAKDAFTAIMVGNLVVPGLTEGKTPEQTSLNPDAIALLRSRYNFTQVIVTDEIADAKSVSYQYDPPTAVSLAIKAGVDMPLFSLNKSKFPTMDAQLKAIVDKVEADVNSKTINEDLINQALNRIANLKAYGSSTSASATTGSQGAPTYIAAGSIPATGLTVGTTTFGGSYRGGSFGPSNNIQGGRTPYDDNGMGYDGKPLPGRTAWAELGNGGSVGTALGGLPKGTKIEITYNGRSVIAEKDDIGRGGGAIDGHPRAVDLWWETARLLDFQSGSGVTTIHAVDPSTPLTPISGQPTAAAPDPNAPATSTVAQSANCCGTPPIGGATSLSGSDNKAKIYNYLLGKLVNGIPLQDYHIAGIMGNMANESSFQPQRLQGTASGVITQAASVAGSSGGYGLVQWTPAGKMINAVTKAGKDPNDMKVQLDFLLEQLNGGTGSAEKGAGNALAGARDVTQATIAFELKYERHAGGPQPARITTAEGVLKEAQAGVFGSAQAPAIGSGPPAATGPITGGSTTAPTIALDPGHGGSTIDRSDPATGLHDGDYDNPVERADVFAVAQIAKSQLEQAGYHVILTKSNVADSVFLRDRANVANNAKADLAVSIHTQGDKAFGTWQEIYTQKDGLFRGSGANVQTFKNPDLSKKSQQYADIMKKARDSTEVTSGTTNIKDNGFNGRSPIEPGNIPLVELWATVPWIYLEAGGNNQTTGLTDQQKATYAKAIVTGVQNAIPSSGVAQPATGGCGDGVAVANAAGLAATVFAYAWPDYHPATYVNKKPEYEAAIQAARKKGFYIGGIAFPGVDCGGFVTRVMQDSGFEPNYNYGGKAGQGNVAGGQSPWLKANWQSLGHVTSSSQLQPGDVAIRNDLGHTYMFVGTIPGFNSVTASSSLDGRSPMAGKDDVTASDIVWYRKK